MNGQGDIGRKIWAMYQNLIGNEEVCAIDRWMLRYFGYRGDKRLTPGLYDELEARIKAEALERGISPSQRQVEIWCESRGDPLSYGDILRRRELNRRTLLARLI